MKATQIIVLFLGLFVSTTHAKDNALINDCVKDVREAAARHVELRKNPLSYLAVTGAGVAAAKVGIDKVSNLPKPVSATSSDPKFQKMISYLSQEFNLAYENRKLEWSLQQATSTFAKSAKAHGKVNFEQLQSAITPKPGILEADYVKSMKMNYLSDATLETIRDFYRKYSGINKSLAANGQALEQLRSNPENLEYRNLASKLYEKTSEYHRLAVLNKNPGEAEKFREKTMQIAERDYAMQLKVGQKAAHSDVFDLMKKAGSGPGVKTAGGVAVGAAAAMAVSVGTAQAKCAGNLQRDEATHLLAFVKASVAEGCQLSDEGAMALAFSPDEQVAKLCEQIPALAKVAEASEMHMMEKLLKLPKFTSVEPDCKDSTLKVKMENGHNYTMKFSTLDNVNYEVSGRVTGDVQREVNFNGKFNSANAEFTSLNSKQNFKGADMMASRSENIFNSYVNNANKNLDSSVEPRVLMGEGSNLFKAFLPAYNQHCGFTGANVQKAEASTTTR